MVANLNMDGFSLENCDVINGIQPSGGLFSESSGFSTASTIEIIILEQGGK